MSQALVRQEPAAGLGAAQLPYTLPPPPFSGAWWQPTTHGKVPSNLTWQLVRGYGAGVPGAPSGTDGYVYTVLMDTGFHFLRVVGRRPDAAGTVQYYIATSSMKALGAGAPYDSGAIGGPWLPLVVIGPPVVGTVAGILLGGPKHRVLGGAIGFGAGVGAFLVFRAAVQAHQDALMKAGPQPVSILKAQFPYQVTSTSGGDAVAAATAAGFHVDGSVAPGPGPIPAVWQGADGAPVPAGLTAAAIPGSQ
jgi:hypothetical protein